MIMSERHHVVMLVMFEPCSFKPTRVHNSNIFARALKIFWVMSGYDFCNGYHTNTKQTIYKHHLQSLILPQIFRVLEIFLQLAA